MAEKKSVIQEFKDFINQGDVIDLAVAVVIGTAFKAVVDSFVKNIVMQIVAAIAGKPTIDAVTIKIGKGNIAIGTFLNDVLGFVIVAFAVFIAVKAFNAMKNFKKSDDGAEAAAPSETDLLTEIRDELRKRG